MTAGSDRGRPAPSARPRERAPRWLLALFLAVVVLAGAGFVFKLAEFARTLRESADVSFALMPIVTYLAVATGFFLLLAWAALGGHFRDLEGPKHFMLENERELDRRTPSADVPAAASPAGDGPGPPGP